MEITDTAALRRQITAAQIDQLTAPLIPAPHWDAGLAALVAADQQLKRSAAVTAALALSTALCLGPLVFALINGTGLPPLVSAGLALIGGVCLLLWLPARLWRGLCRQRRNHLVRALHKAGAGALNNEGRWTVYDPGSYTALASQAVDASRHH